MNGLKPKVFHSYPVILLKFHLYVVFLIPFTAELSAMCYRCMSDDSGATGDPVHHGVTAVPGLPWCGC